ncbi:MAG TPA: dioxygenase [Phenylobacterium sp.]|uniref:dioxygenase family protein n=1 Tax=Phenylobacterium sp. TaxID=1871053 RepID=UPI002B49BD4C|nr:dioxygenase [Phenylobacterium sp.]HKR89322.1 dioxygenase [Phenylobacterium sp.]HKT53225.1 dioxygenase [Caulobacteraceae bacterium]
MIVEDPDQLTADVIAVMDRTQDPRLREIMSCLIRHLHGFVREVRLTEDEFRTATALINEMGQLTNDTHNETVLMAGSLGVSSLVCMINNPGSSSRRTSQSLLGPFWRMHSPRTENGGSILRSATPGPALFMTGRIVDPNGEPIAGAEVDVWQSAPNGLYENQDSEQADMNLRGKFTTDADGRFWFRTVKPAGYPIPTDGVVGRLLAAQGRHPFRPAHMHALAYKPGFKTLISQVYLADDERLDSDAQFGVSRHLIGRLERHGEAHPTETVDAPWYSLDYTFVMQPGEATLPRPPIK